MKTSIYPFTISSVRRCKRDFHSRRKIKEKKMRRKQERVGRGKRVYYVYWYSIRMLEKGSKVKQVTQDRLHMVKASWKLYSRIMVTEHPPSNLQRLMSLIKLSQQMGCSSDDGCLSTLPPRYR